MNLDPIIVIPALNAAHALLQVLEKLPTSRCVVIDDGSTDGTAEVASRNGFLVLRHPTNLGLTAAIHTGVAYAREKGFTHVLLMDADGQHPPELYSKFFAEMSTNEFVLGDRFSCLSEIPPEKIASNLFASLMVQQVTGVFVRDISCGYRGYRLSNSSSVDECRGYGFIYSQLIQYLDAGVIPARVKVPAIYDMRRPLATKVKEVEALHNSLTKVASDNKLVRQLGKSIYKRWDIRITFEKCRFIGRYIEAWNSYLFETDISTAIAYYEN
jgi:glycosyltransferase involved in cell wall biosynthesis